MRTSRKSNRRRLLLAYWLSVGAAAGFWSGVAHYWFYAQIDAASSTQCVYSADVNFRKTEVFLLAVTVLAASVFAGLARRTPVPRMLAHFSWIILWFSGALCGSSYVFWINSPAPTIVVAYENLACTAPLPVYGHGKIKFFQLG